MAGHVHLLELDQYVGERFLVTVHGPLNPDVPVERSVVETGGALRPDGGGPAAPRVVSTPVLRHRVGCLGLEQAVVGCHSGSPSGSAGLERRVMVDDFRHPESLLEEMFLVRHELLTVRTMAGQSCGFRHLRSADRAVRTDGRPGGSAIAADQFDRVRSLSDGERSSCSASSICTRPGWPPV